jgi:putative membrane protein
MLLVQTWTLWIGPVETKSFVGRIQLMKMHLLNLLAVSLISIQATSVNAASAEAPPTWHAQSLAEALGYMLLFAAIGIAAAILGYKAFDKCTPGDLHTEILQNKNIAAAIVAAAVILGVCIIIAAAMLG